LETQHYIFTGTTPIRFPFPAFVVNTTCLGIILIKETGSLDGGHFKRRFKKKKN
jgi:hypothetical protein